MQHDVVESRLFARVTRGGHVVKDGVGIGGGALVSRAAGGAFAPANPIPAPTEFSPRVLNTDDLDVPAFLRNRSNSQR